MSEKALPGSFSYPSRAALKMDQKLDVSAEGATWEDSKSDTGELVSDVGDRKTIGVEVDERIRLRRV